MITKLSQTKEDNQGQTNTTEDKQIQPKTTIDIKDNQSRQEYQGQPKTQDNQRQPKTARQTYSTKGKQ